MAIDVCIHSLNIRAYDENREKLKEFEGYVSGAEYDINDLSIAMIAGKKVQVEMLQQNNGGSLRFMINDRQ